MPLEMSFEDARGVTHPDSHWVLARVKVDVPGKTAELVFLGYASRKALADGKQPVAARRYALTPDTWDGTLRALGLDLSLLVAPCYALAKADPDAFFGRAAEVA